MGWYLFIWLVCSFNVSACWMICSQKQWFFTVFLTPISTVPRIMAGNRAGAPYMLVEWVMMEFIVFCRLGRFSGHLFYPVIHCIDLVSYSPLSWIICLVNMLATCLSFVSSQLSWSSDLSIYSFGLNSGTIPDLVYGPGQPAYLFRACFLGCNMRIRAGPPPEVVTRVEFVNVPRIQRQAHSMCSVKGF